MDTQSGDPWGPGGLPPPPPSSPGSEPLVTSDETGVVAFADTLTKAIQKRGMTVVRKVVSRNSDYGVVWRADMSVTGDNHAQSRLICWKVPGVGSFTFLSLPLEMFDPSESIPPLSP